MKERIRKLRIDSGMTQSQFGEILGVKQKAVSMIEAGTNTPTTQQIEALSRFFGVSADWIIFGVEMPSNSDIELLEMIKNDAPLFSSLMSVLAAKKTVNNVIRL